MKIINFEEVVASFSFEEAIQVMKKCFFDYESGKISQKCVCDDACLFGRE